jgi:hypothetical protein
VLIEPHSGKLPEPLSYVRYLLRAGWGGEVLISYAFRNTDISGSEYGHNVNCSNNDVSLSRILWFFGCVRHSLVIVFSVTLIVIHNHSSAYESDIVRSSNRTGSTLVRSIPLSQLKFERGTEIDQCPTSSLPRSDVVKS